MKTYVIFLCEQRINYYKIKKNCVRLITITSLYPLLLTSNLLVEWRR